MIAVLTMVETGRSLFEVPVVVMVMIVVKSGAPGLGPTPWGW